MKAERWAEAVANNLCSFNDVPDKFKDEVRYLLDKLLDPHEPILPVRMINTSYKRNE